MSVAPAPKPETDSAWTDYDRLSELAADPSASQPDIAAAASAVALDLRRRAREAEARRRVLAQRISDPDRDARASSRAARFMPLVILLDVLIVAGVLGWVSYTTGRLLFFGVAAAASLGTAAGGFFVIRALRRRSRTLTEPARTTCPACAYDLSGLPDELPRRWVALPSGPKRCPECGEPWPLVPRIP